MAYLTRDETIKAIRTALRKRSGKAWSVKGGRGTAYGWIHVSPPPARLGCPREHRFNYSTGDCDVCGQRVAMSGERFAACPAHECTDRCYRGYITPEDRQELADLLGLDYVHVQGVSIPASSAYYTEYVARAAGIGAPAVVGVPYWD